MATASVGARLSQAHHDRRRPRQRAARACRQSARCAVGAPLVVLGGPAMLIGLGGGAASSVGSGQSSCRSGFCLGAARQRRDPTPRAGSDRPLLGAGRRESHPAHSRRGRGRTCPTRCRRPSRTAGAARRIDLRRIASAEPGLSPMEIWCNEAQERYVIALRPKSLERFAAIVRARALPVRGGRRDYRRRTPRRDRSSVATTPGRHADRRAARQDASHDAQRASSAAQAAAIALDRRHRLSPIPLYRAAATADGGGQVVPDHHRRPHRRRADQPRSDGRPLAGSGGGCRGDV